VLKALSGQKLWAFDRDARRHAVRLAAELGLKGQLNLNLLPKSIQAFGSEAMFDTIDAAVAHGLRPEQIVLEVSESEAFPDFASFLKLVRECRARGVKFAIDDFGAGHSGLNLLADFQPDSLKVDMKLVRDIASKGPRQAIIRGLLVTCSDLGIDVVAEGVETMDEFTWLRDEGVSLFQGYLFAKPLFEAFPAVAFPRMAALPPLSSSEATSPDQVISAHAQSAEAH
jgi:blue light- and temperature-responsive anti-repressor